MAQRCIGGKFHDCKSYNYTDGIEDDRLRIGDGRLVFLRQAIFEILIAEHADDFVRAIRTADGDQRQRHTVERIGLDRFTTSP